jgi:hypothetical protein
MIVVRLIGGLGNQLFQYAAGRALARRRGVDLGLDVRAYANNRRRYGLDAFAIKVAPVENRALPPRGLLDLLLGRLAGRSPFTVYRENGPGFDPAVLSMPDGTYLKGYFQSDRYFADAVSEIRDELRTIGLPNTARTALQAAIADTCAVSLHVRRGDYLTDPKVNRVHGVLDIDYYLRATELIAARVGVEPTFFAFSDDPDWVEANLRLRFPLVVVRQRGAAHEDLRLMAACRHHIVANSSFSWWGAWLNPSPDKIVVAPKAWFRDPAIDTSTLVPEGWLRT